MRVTITNRTLMQEQGTTRTALFIIIGIALLMYVVRLLQKFSMRSKSGRDTHSDSITLMVLLSLDVFPLVLYYILHIIFSIISIFFQ